MAEAKATPRSTEYILLTCAWAGRTMRVLIGGATGAIGRPLIGFLRQRGHAVFALARSPGSARVVAASEADAHSAIAYPPPDLCRNGPLRRNGVDPTSAVESRLSTLLRQSRWRRRRTGMGHKERFLQPMLSGGCGLG